jgi:hypothetical protein
MSFDSLILMDRAWSIKLLHASLDWAYFAFKSFACIEEDSDRYFAVFSCVSGNFTSFSLFYGLKEDF